MPDYPFGESKSLPHNKAKAAGKKAAAAAAAAATSKKAAGDIGAKIGARKGPAVQKFITPKTKPKWMSERLWKEDQAYNAAVKAYDDSSKVFFDDTTWTKKQPTYPKYEDYYTD